MAARDSRLRVVVAALVTVAVVAALAWAVHAHRGSSGASPAARTTSGPVTATDPTSDQSKLGSSDSDSADPSPGDPGSSSSSSSDPHSSGPDTSDPTSPDPSSSDPSSSDPSSSRSSSDPSSGANRPRHPVQTRGGMWWGVDSSGPITAAAIANVRDWYVGHHKPQFWGRYISGDYAVSAKELAYARSQGIYVYLLVNDANCSVCSNGHDVCGHDKSAGQARSDAHDALDAATKLSVPEGTILFKDIEQVGSCRGEPTATYLDTWYRTLRDTHYRTGFYGNVHEQSFDFPRAYCATVAKDPKFRDDVSLDMNENEPQLGAPRQTVGPGNAPDFTPNKPDCAPSHAVKLWQYGESTSRSNYTDIDQAKPDIDGLLAPDGGVTGG